MKWLVAYLLSKSYVNNHVVQVPVGVPIAFFGKTLPSGYLDCDGSTYTDEEEPELFNEIADEFKIDEHTFRVPDLREVTLVGIGTNSTETIENHDTYTLGQFKDDQLQDHRHSMINYNGQTVKPNNSAGYNWAGVTNSDPKTEFKTNGVEALSDSTVRIGETTHGKQVGVRYIIKARSHK